MKVQPIEAHEQSSVNMAGASGVKMRMLIGPSDGAESFHMRHFEIEPGGFTPHHNHDFEHQIITLKGAGVVRSAAGDRPFDARTVIWVPADEMHQFRNTGGGPLEFICLIPAPDCCAR